MLQLKREFGTVFGPVHDGVRDFGQFGQMSVGISVSQLMIGDDVEAGIQEDLEGGVVRAPFHTQ